MWFPFIVCLVLFVVSVATGKALPGNGDAYVAALFVIYAIGNKRKEEQ